MNVHWRRISNGLILCAGKKKERIELLEFGRSGFMSQYLTYSKKTLQDKLHKAIKHARNRFEVQDSKRK